MSNLVQRARRTALGMRWSVEAFARTSNPRWRNAGEPHGLPGELIISLTSFGPRIPKLHYTLRTLLEQDFKPDRVILWLAHDDAVELPTSITKLQSRGLDIRTVPDLKSYKKLVFALAQFPDAFIVTADDDVLYDRDWLRQIVSGFDSCEPTIICRRAHRIAFSTSGIAPYNLWEKNVSDDRAALPSIDLLPVGIGGTLYPPHSLHPDVVRDDLFMDLAPKADDLWFWWMGRRLKSRVKRVGPEMTYRYTPGSQDAALKHNNLAGGNDIQLSALIREFGVDEVLDSHNK